MLTLIGLAVTVVMVFGGYTFAGGKLSIILHSLPYEMTMIGGAGLGAFLAANDFHAIKQTGGDIVAVIKGPKWKRADYQDALCLMHKLIALFRESPVEVEAHIEDPKNSALFSKYPRIQSDGVAVEIICDTIRSMMMNFDNPHQVEELLEKQLEQLKEERLHGAHALGALADALPALGIVAAVLGVIKTMASIDKPPEILGQMIGGALVGTFLGVFLAYGVFGPLAARVRTVREQEHAFYELFREVLVSTLHRHAPNICVEVGRRRVPSGLRPSFTELETALKEAA
ncbi:flagellar motor stator protein MotA [Parvularcula dongshanensis]|uniref:Chemotaxis protein MotA n=1 Tax=Parvularcula dongshanensis TaxID=1173995 RepID=A0A840I660_9PROT|nr:flagellar motor stator protein MotA [Parvularcula dongshanensis]MBB4659628.1 chemotaxis protein MotA [Parvularcula dongshanensis]